MIREGYRLWFGKCNDFNLHGVFSRDNPRAADLGSADVQAYSDRELFWIVSNGIRLSGMPAFRKVESDEHIWNLVHYVRTLPDSANPRSGRTAN